MRKNAFTTVMLALILMALSLNAEAGGIFGFGTPKPLPGELAKLLSENGKPEQIIELIDRGADVNELDERGFTPLHHAMWFNQKGKDYLDVVRRLIASGADVNCQRARQGKFTLMPRHTKLWLTRWHVRQTILIQ